jgi:hypothetical protein
MQPVLLVKLGKYLTFAQAEAAGWKGVKIQSCKSGHPDIAGFGIFPMTDGKLGPCQTVFAHLKDAVAALE